jgi:hypothetical protein
VATTANVVGPPIPAPPDSEMAMFALASPVQDDDGYVYDIISGDQEYGDHPAMVESHQQSHSFTNWLETGDPSSLAFGDRFFFPPSADVPSSDDETIASRHSNNNSANTTTMEDDAFCFTLLPLPDDVGCNIPPTIDVGHMYASPWFRGLDVPNLYPAQKRLMNYLKTNSLPPTIYDWVHEWAQECCHLSYKFESPSGITVMKQMAEKYQKFTGDPPTTIYKSLMNNLPPYPISS